MPFAIATEVYPPIPLAMWLYLTLLAIGWGACVGSFLNVCIYRIPREESVVAPRSHCPHCDALIPWYLNIPVLSYLCLRGKCKFCQGPIRPRYMLVELLTCALFVLIWLRYTPTGDPRPLALTPTTHMVLIPVYWYFAATLILGTFVDFEHMIIPNRVTLGGIAAGLACSFLMPALHDESSHWAGLLQSLIGAATGWGLLWGVAWFGSIIFRKEAMGFGDVKLLGAVGAFLGWRAVLFTVMGSSLVGSVVGVTLIASRKGKLQSKIPYGPYLALAAVIWMLWGPSLWGAYARLLLPAETL